VARSAPRIINSPEFSQFLTIAALDPLAEVEGFERV
jgi:hypothetical protein